MTLDALDRMLRPLRCAGCGRAGIALCDACAASLPRPATPRSVPGVDRTLVPWSYSELPRRLVLDLKVRGIRRAAAPLVAGTSTKAATEGVVAATVTWVPGRRADIRRRGFDHAEVLARGVAQRLGLPARRLLARDVTSVDQAGLGAAERRRNMRGAFRAYRCCGSLLLVDDVVTTGATGAACAAALRAAGGTGIELLAACSV